jgi:amino acid adenylation domain-containing protein
MTDEGNTRSQASAAMSSAAGMPNMNPSSLTEETQLLGACRERVCVTLSSTLIKRLRNLARQRHVSLLCVLTSAWAIVLSRWSDQQEVRVGTRTANDIRLEPHRTMSVSELLAHVEDRLAEAHASSTNRAGSQATSFQQDGWAGVLSSSELAFDLLFSDAGARLKCTLEDRAGRSDVETMERMAQGWREVLRGMAKHAERPIGKLGMLTFVERNRVLTWNNDTAAPYPQDRWVHELFEAQVRRTPHAIALEHDGESLSYAELNRRANQLAHYLNQRAVTANQLVGICIERGFAMVVGLLAILKSGAAYVPLDPSYPPERLHHMLEDAQPAVVLTQQTLRDVLPDTSAEVIVLDAIAEELASFSRQDPSFAERSENADSRVYVIFTSGSTGRPKGTQMAHRSMVNLIEWHRRTLSCGEDGSDGTRVLQFAALSFDVAFQEIFSTLCTGGTLVLIDEWVRRDARALLHLLHDRSIHRWFVPPMLLQAVAEVATDVGVSADRLQDVITAGEQLRISAEIVEFFKRLPACKLHNHYGPTETHVVTALTLPSDRQSWPVLPSIGRPIANTQIYVLDVDLQPVPTGVTGEIFIGGANVALGYLGRPEITALRFIPDPFGTDGNARLYRTGDLGRWQADGSIQYLGRNDDQVKIRGFRVELGEIEAQLVRHPSVKHAALVAHEVKPGAKRLIAYVTLREGRSPQLRELRAHLAARVPDYMVPSAFVILESLPLTPSGKLDRRRLPPPDSSAYVSREYEAPLNEQEQTLARVWQSLLRVERVGRQDNFFELGGDSLLVARMMESLRRTGWQIQVQAAFASPTLATLAGELTRELPAEVEIPTASIPPGCQRITREMLPLLEVDQACIDRLIQATPGGAQNIQDIYPLAPLQEGLLFLHLLDERSADAYIASTVLHVPSREQLTRLVAALQAVIDRHDALRTSVHWEQLPRPVQVVHRHATLRVEHQGIRGSDADVESQLREWMKPECQQMNLNQAPLIRLRVAKDPHGEGCHVLLQMHHLIGDNTAEEIVRSEVAAHLRGRERELATPLPYRNHVAHVIAQARESDPEAFFRSKLSDVSEPTLPFAVADVRGNSRIEESRQTLEPVLARRLRAQAGRLGTSPAVLFHAAWGLVVAHTSAREDIVFGTVLLGRLQGNADGERMLGLFINTLPLRLQLQDLTAADLVERTHAELVDLLGYEQTPLSLAQRCSGVIGQSSLFSSLLNYRHEARDTGDEWVAGESIRLLAHRDRTNYPITFIVDDLASDFVLTAQTDGRVDPGRVVRYVHTALQSLVEALEREPQKAAMELSILPQDEWQQVVDSFNQTRRAYPRQTLVHRLFEDQVARTPNAVAVTDEKQSLSYAQLSARANQLARGLRAKGVGPDQLVGLCMERSVEMVVGLFGILKAGGAYVPLDPTYPPERLSYMLKDAAPRVLLVQEHLKHKLPNVPCEVLALDAQWDQIASLDRSDLDPSVLGVREDHLAYVIYTSGSTGQPKGAMNEHRGVVNRLLWMQEAYGLSSADVVLQKTPFSFDVSVWEFFWTLLAGARLVMARPEGHKDPAYLMQVIEAQRVTTLHFVPSMLQSFVDHVPSGRCPSLRHVVCSGEELPVALQARLLRQFPQVQLSNLYGPTEAAVDVTAWECRAEDPSPRVPIGRPIANVRMYVLDRRRRPVPVGVAGEIYIGGVAVGRGYLNRTELTAERFLKDALSAEPDARLYRTGDMGRWRADGVLEYLGRNDDQVKIRGFRIELGEIEAELLKHEAVKDAVVIAREDTPGDKRLVAYVTARAESTLDLEDLRLRLRSTLPEHMVPSAIVVMEAIPLTASGKRNRRALPAPTADAYIRREYEAPHGEFETMLAQLWQELLQVDRVGRNDNFFELGGHSLLAMQVIVRIQSAFSVDMPMSSLFESPTVKQMNDRFEQCRQAQFHEVISAGGNDIEALLEKVASMSEAEVQEWMRERQMGVSQ